MAFAYRMRLAAIVPIACPRRTSKTHSVIASWMSVRRNTRRCAFGTSRAIVSSRSCDNEPYEPQFQKSTSEPHGDRALPFAGERQQDLESGTGEQREFMHAVLALKPVTTLEVANGGANGRICTVSRYTEPMQL
jgi:hypothetical protein